MDYFEILLKEIETGINNETELMMDATKKLKESSDKLEQLKKQKNTVLALTNKLANPY